MQNSGTASEVVYVSSEELHAIMKRWRSSNHEPLDLFVKDITPILEWEHEAYKYRVKDLHKYLALKIKYGF